MIELKEIRITDKEQYRYFENILQTNFPVCEYRPLNELKTVIEERKEFKANLIVHDNIPIGILSFWDFDKFYYIEHFAIESKKRKGGLGGKTIAEFCKKSEKPIVLEVEIPEDEISSRRIEFYQRHKFMLWEKEYLQPPYRKGDNYFPLQLMVYGNLSPEHDFIQIRNTLHREVYNIQ